jgi:hypothetical protein
MLANPDTLVNISELSRFRVTRIRHRGTKHTSYIVRPMVFLVRLKHGGRRGKSIVQREEGDIMELQTI